MSHIFLCHDFYEFASTRAEVWRSYGYEVTHSKTVREALDIISMGLEDTSILVLHKDFGDYSHEPDGAKRVLQALESHEGYEYIRRMYISGEFRDGINHVKQDRMDAYFPTVLASSDPWLLNHFNRGYVTIEEIQRRGRDVDMPPGNFGPPARTSLTQLFS